MHGSGEDCTRERRCGGVCFQGPLDVSLFVELAQAPLDADRVGGIEVDAPVVSRAMR